MKNKLVVASLAIISAMAVSSSCNKSNPDPEPTPIETYTVRAYYDFSFGGTGATDSINTVSKMLDLYQSKGFIESHDGMVATATPIILEKTGVAPADTSATLASLRKELKEKLTNASKEIKSTDWIKTFGTDNFRCGYVKLGAVTETGEVIDATSFCLIPMAEFGKEYTTEDTTQSLQKFKISEEMYNKVPMYRLGKATFKDKGEVDIVAVLGGSGSVTINVKDSSKVTELYYLYYDKPSSGKEMTLKKMKISGKEEAVSAKYKTN